MKRKTAALYNPYLDVLGGGEKHILSIMKVLEDEDYDVQIYWDTDLSSQIKSKLNISFQRLSFIPNIFQKNSSFLDKFSLLGKHDLFFYVTDGSYFFSNARKNFVFCMIPQKDLYPSSVINKLKTANYHFITNSKYTQNWLNKWNINSTVIYPFVDKIFIKENQQSKQKIILSVGRFFKHLHAKKHDVLINTFKKLKETHPSFQEYKLILAGSAKTEDEDYVQELKAMIKDDSSIMIKDNVPFTELVALYRSAEYYWHFTGYGVDEQRHPEQVEHLGITPLEAMASGCLTFCYNAGGPQEIIKTGETGFLFNDTDELMKQMNEITQNSGRQEDIRSTAKQFVSDNFSYEIFRGNVLQTIQ